MRRERFKSWKDALEKNRNIVIYLLTVLGLLCAAVAWNLLPSKVSRRAQTSGVSPDSIRPPGKQTSPGWRRRVRARTSEDVVYHPKLRLIGMHSGMLALFTFLFPQAVGQDSPHGVGQLQAGSQNGCLFPLQAAGVIAGEPSPGRQAGAHVQADRQGHRPP